MMNTDELRELAQAWSEGVEPGPWHPAHAGSGGAIVLDNAAGDSLFVNPEDAAVLVNALPEIIARLDERDRLRAALAVPPVPDPDPDLAYRPDGSVAGRVVGWSDDGVPVLE